jgi:hypothetical protein
MTARGDLSRLAKRAQKQGTAYTDVGGPATYRSETPKAGCFSDSLPPHATATHRDMLSGAFGRYSRKETHVVTISDIQVLLDNLEMCDMYFDEPLDMEDGTFLWSGTSVDGTTHLAAHGDGQYLKLEMWFY